MDDEKVLLIRRSLEKGDGLLLLLFVPVSEKRDQNVGIDKISFTRPLSPS